MVRPRARQKRALENNPENTCDAKRIKVDKKVQKSGQKVSSMRLYFNTCNDYDAKKMENLIRYLICIGLIFGMNKNHNSSTQLTPQKQSNNTFRKFSCIWVAWIVITKIQTRIRPDLFTIYWTFQCISNSNFFLNFCVGITYFYPCVKMEKTD